VLWKFFQFEGRFPDYHQEVPLPAVDDVAEQLDVPVSTGVCVAMASICAAAHIGSYAESMNMQISRHQVFEMKTL